MTILEQFDPCQETVINPDMIIENHVENCYLWPDGETAEKIYQEAGFRTVAIKAAGRAAIRKEE